MHTNIGSEEKVHSAPIIKGKRCVVVAPSGYLRGRGQRSGEFVEEFDLVAKCTRTVDILDKDNELGGRCDLWYGLPNHPNVPWALTQEAIDRQNIKHLFLQPRLDLYASTWDNYMSGFWDSDLSKQTPWSITPEKLYKDLIKKFDCIPFTGVFAIYHLLSMGAKEVYAYGHDFYLSGYFNDITPNRCEESDWHKKEPQMKFLWDLINFEPRFKCDPNLAQLLSNKFGSSAQQDTEKSRLFCSDIRHFFYSSAEQENILLFRSCNILIFNKLIEDLNANLQTSSVHIFAQEKIVDELIDNEYEVISYPENTFKFSQLKSLLPLQNLDFTSCLIPYNGLELYTYLDIFKSLQWLKIKRVFLISPRGALSQVSDLSILISSIERYLSMQEEFKLLADKFDRRNCL